MNPDTKAVKEGVMGEAAPLDRLAASFYNRPTLPSFFDKYLYDPWGNPVYGGSRFLRWHELSDEQKAKVRAGLAARLKELGVTVEAE